MKFFADFSILGIKIDLYLHSLNAKYSLSFTNKVTFE